MKNFLKKYWEYIVAFLVPIIIVLLHCIMRDSWLLGKGSILSGDAGRQYYVIFEELWDKVHNGDFSFFSWKAACGFDFYLNMIYYTISPTTLLVLFLPKNCLENVLQLIMVLDWALLSFSGTYFFMHTKFNTLKNNKRFVSLTLGLCFSMSTFVIDLLVVFNWLDTIILFPFLLLLIEKMIENGKWKNYYILLVISMVCNFYISFPICICLLLWFVLQVTTKTKVDKKVWLTFLASSIGAAITSMGVILPCVINVSGRYVDEGNENIINYISKMLLPPQAVIRKFFAFSLRHENDVLDMRLYMSIGMIILSMMYIFLKLKKRTKYCKLGIVILLLCSMCFGALDLVWHAFSIPHGYAPRYGFILILILLVMALDVLCHLDQLKVWHCIVSLVTGVILFFVAFFTIDQFEDPFVYLITLMLFIFDIILLVLLCRKSIQKKSFVYVLLTLCIIELCGNAYYQFDKYDSLRPLERENLYEAVDLSEKISLKAGERILFDHTEYNTGLLTDTPAMSGFISYANGALGNLFFQNGMHLLQDAGWFYLGGSPLNNLMFNVAYGVGMYKTEFEDSLLETEGEELNVYKMNHIAGLGFMTKDSVENWNVYNLSPFDIQNNFVDNATTVENSKLFTPFLPSDMKCTTIIGELNMAEGLQESDVFAYQYTSLAAEDGIIFEFEAEADENIYLTMRNTVESYIYISVDEEVIYESSMPYTQIVMPIGNVKKGQKVKILCAFEDSIGELVQFAGQFATWNEDVWQETLKELTDEVYQIDTFESDYISGTIESKEDGIMMTSIPAMKGFTVYVDGSKSDYKEIGSALIGVPLKAGKHVVEFRYRTPYAVLGWLISIFSLGIFAIICIRGRKKNVSVFCEES